MTSFLVLDNIEKILSKVVNTFENIMEIEHLLHRENAPFSIIFSNMSIFKGVIKMRYNGVKG